MALSHLQIEEINMAGKSFLEVHRPSEEIRKELDLAYSIEGQSVMVYEIRPRWDQPFEIVREPVAKTTFVQSEGHWKVFWMRANLKWVSYTPKPVVKSIKQFFELVGKDEHACFFG